MSIIKYYEVDHIYGPALKNQKYMLLFGANEGMVAYFIKSLTQKNKLYINSQKNFIELNSLDKELTELKLILGAFSLLNDQQITILTHDNNNKNQALGKLLTNIEKEKFPINGPLIIFSKVLNSQSALVKQISKAKNGFTIACYETTNKQKLQFIKSITNYFSLNFNNEILNYLQNYLSSDFLQIYQEIEKLSLYFYNNNNSSINNLQKISSLIGDKIHKQYFLLYHFLLVGDINMFIRIFYSLKSQNITPITFINIFSNHLKKILNIAKLVQLGSNIETACKQQKPPIFFKLIDDYKLQLNKWSYKDLVFLHYYVELLFNKIMNDSQQAEEILNFSFFIICNYYKSNYFKQIIRVAVNASQQDLVALRLNK